MLFDKPLSEVEDETIILADIARKAVAEIGAEAAMLLSESVAADKAADIAHTLTEGRWTHDYGMSATEAKSLGLPVSAEMPGQILGLMDPLRTAAAPRQRDRLRGTIQHRPIQQLAGFDFAQCSFGARAG